MIQRGFDTNAAGYDYPSLRFFPETARRLVEYLELQPHQHLLDVCTGTGVDFSSGMLNMQHTKPLQKT